MAFVFKAIQQSEGQGARVLRIVGGQQLRNFDPFLLLDFAKVKLPAAFPDHPHRGFQTVTYALQGTGYHEDFKGHKGKTSAGDIQWMTAGRGIVHSQVPGSFQEESIGFQLWINLEKKYKMIEPSYQEIKKEKFEIWKDNNAQVKIIAGKWGERTGPIVVKTPVYYFDVRILPNGRFQSLIPKSWNSLIFVIEGRATYEDKMQINTFFCCVLNKGEGEGVINHRFSSQQGCRFILIAGQPLNEPIAQGGPFVMNTQAQLKQAYSDYYNGKNGFQGARDWKSRVQLLTKGVKYEDL